jgi:hypothetical protein
MSSNTVRAIVHLFVLSIFRSQNVVTFDIWIRLNKSIHDCVSLVVLHKCGRVWWCKWCKIKIRFQEPVTTPKIMHQKNGKHKNLQKRKRSYVFTALERSCKKKLPLMLLHIRLRVWNGNSLLVGLFHPVRRFHVTSVCVTMRHSGLQQGWTILLTSASGFKNSEVKNKRDNLLNVLHFHQIGPKIRVCNIGHFCTKYSRVDISKL